MNVNFEEFYGKTLKKFKTPDMRQLSLTVSLSKQFWCGYCTTVEDLRPPTGFSI